MAYEFTCFSREHSYWLGTEPASSRHILGIPVSNPMVDYIESYWIADLLPRTLRRLVGR